MQKNNNYLMLNNAILRVNDVLVLDNVTYTFKNGIYAFDSLYANDILEYISNDNYGVITNSSKFIVKDIINDKYTYIEDYIKDRKLIELFNLQNQILAKLTIEGKEFVNFLKALDSENNVIIYKNSNLSNKDIKKLKKYFKDKIIFLGNLDIVKKEIEKTKFSNNVLKSTPKTKKIQRKSNLKHVNIVTIDDKKIGYIAYSNYLNDLKFIFKSKSRIILSILLLLYIALSIPFVTFDRVYADYLTIKANDSIVINMAFSEVNDIYKIDYHGLRNAEGFYQYEYENIFKDYNYHVIYDETINDSSIITIKDDRNLLINDVATDAIYITNDLPEGYEFSSNKQAFYLSETLYNELMTKDHTLFADNNFYPFYQFKIASTPAKLDINKFEGVVTDADIAKTYEYLDYDNINRIIFVTDDILKFYFYNAISTCVIRLNITNIDNLYFTLKELYDNYSVLPILSYADYFCLDNAEATYFKYMIGFYSFLGLILIVTLVLKTKMIKKNLKKGESRKRYLKDIVKKSLFTSLILTVVLSLIMYLFVFLVNYCHMITVPFVERLVCMVQYNPVQVILLYALVFFSIFMMHIVNKNRYTYNN